MSARRPRIATPPAVAGDADGLRDGMTDEPDAALPPNFPRRGCSLALGAALLAPVLLCGGCFLAAGRSETVRNGYRLPPTAAGPLTFSTWSYGEWVVERRGFTTVTRFGPPYTLVLAASCDAPGVLEVELTAADLIETDGSATPVLGDLEERRGPIEDRPNSALAAPYAAFHWADRFDGRPVLTLRITAVLRGGERDGEAVTTTLRVPMTEGEPETGWVVWDRIMSA